MQQIKILFTGHRFDSSVLLEKPSNIEIEVIPFIETKLSEEIFQIEQLIYISQLETTVIVTSQNSVEWIQNHIKIIPNWKIACTEGRTLEKLIEIGWGHLVQSKATNGLDLAKKIIQNNIQEVYFFCSHKRLEQLPVYLNSLGCKVQEITAYYTYYLSQKINKKYDGIVFLSPSAVESFFEKNKIPINIQIFAIGSTTCAAIKEFCMNPIYISEIPEQKNLFNYLYKYFQTI